MTHAFHRLALAIPLALGAVSGALAQADSSNIELTTPINGWRNSAGDDSRYTQDVHYPAVSVSTPQGQRTTSMIAGRIRNTPKVTAPADDSKPRRRRGADGSSVGTLVVNGVAMPQRIEADGTFSRPYAFGAGSNSVEVRSARGDAKRVQFYDSYTGKQRPRLRVVLSWDTDGTDLDLHVISPDGQHAWFGNRVAQNGGALDVDVTTGYGPEIYSNPAPVPGTYLVYVNYYGSGSDNSIITTATVSIITDENTPSERQQTFVVPMRKAGDLTLLRSFTVK
ncbi:YfaP family protein [Ralstonia sp. R-29]|uniref:YfaP family protein n=1 Tax=Ralstonia sp. R-29 TaxID=3404059 RepID=UPI003CEB0D6D